MQLPKYFGYDLLIKVNAELVCRVLSSSGRDVKNRRMSSGNLETKHRGIPRLSSKGECRRLEVILERRFDDIWKVDCHVYNILIEMGWRRHRRQRRGELRVNGRTQSHSLNVY